MQKYRWFLESPWVFALTGALLLLVSVTKHITIWETKFTLVDGWMLHVVGYVGLASILVGFAAAVMKFGRTSAIQTTALIGPAAIYGEAKKMIDSCQGHEIIRATSISTGMPGDDDSNENDYVESYLSSIAKKCAEAKRDNHDLLYKTVLGFLPGGAGVPPEHKKLSITRRRDLFAKAGAPDRLLMKYIETDWSLDVLIVGTKQMIIAFPTLPRDRHLRIGLRIQSEPFVHQAVRWYDDCVLEQAKDIDWPPAESKAG